MAECQFCGREFGDLNMVVGTYATELSPSDRHAINKLESMMTGDVDCDTALEIAIDAIKKREGERIFGTIELVFMLGEAAWQELDLRYEKYESEIKANLRERDADGDFTGEFMSEMLMSTDMCKCGHHREEHVPECKSDLCRCGHEKILHDGQCQMRGCPCQRFYDCQCPGFVDVDPRARKKNDEVVIDETGVPFARRLSQLEPDSIIYLCWRCERWAERTLIKELRKKLTMGRGENVVNFAREIDEKED